MARQANWDDLHAIQTWRHAEFAVAVQNQHGFTPRQSSIPLDGKGLRIKILIKPGEVPDFQSMKGVEFILAGEVLEVPIEIREDHKKFHALSVTR